MLKNQAENHDIKIQSTYVKIWIVSAVVIPTILDYIFMGTSAARYSRVLIFLLIAVSLLLNSQHFLKGKLHGVDTILLTIALFSVGTYSAVIRGGDLTPNFALLILLLLIVSLNPDLYKTALNSIGFSCHLLVFVSIFIIFLRLNPRDYNFSSVGYPVFFDFIGIPGRNVGIFTHPNTLGQVAVLSVFFLLESRVKLYLLIAPIFCILKSGSRTAIICLVVGLLIYSIASLFKNSKLSRKSGIESTLTIGMFIVCFLLASSAQFLNYINFLDPGSLTGRVSIWQTSSSIFQESPILGLGWGWELRAIDSQLLNYWAVSTHNVILEIIFSSGILGLVLFLTIISKPIIFFTTYTGKEKAILAVVTVAGVSESAIDLQYPTILTLLFLMIILGSNLKKEKLN